MESANLTILIVDDEDLVRMVGSDILETGGYRVLEAANAGEALHCLEDAQDVAILFTDVNMPGSPDGCGLARLVRERWPQVKILVASGQAVPGRGELPEESRFISKPYRADALLGALRDLTQNHR